MGRSGYECSYRVWKDDEIISQYRRILGVYGSCTMKKYLFEMRTNFKLVGDDPAMMGSEIFGFVLLENADEPLLKSYFEERLKDYWMSDDEIQLLACDAFGFAKGRAEVDSSSVIAVVVGVDVCTVPQEGEAIKAAVDRAISPECLLPLHACAYSTRKICPNVNRNPFHYRMWFLMELPRIRVEDEAGLALMETCPICSLNSVIGAQISVLPCNHACHSLCVYRWVNNGKGECPSCGLLLPKDYYLESDSDSDSQI